MNEKKCNKCGRVLPLGEFHKNKSKKDGLQGQCKQCVAVNDRKHREANKEKIAERQRKWYEANKEKIAERQRKHYEANKEKIAEYHRKYQQANKEKVKEWSRKYKQANKEKIAVNDRKYKQANKEKIAVNDRKYREANKEKIAEYHRKYQQANKNKRAERMRERRKNDPEYRAMCEVRQMTRRIEKGDKRSLEIYGVPSREWAAKIRRGRIRIYDKYFKGVKKHLDHIRPLAEVKHSVEEMHKRSHFTNLVYIPAKANQSKSATPFWEWFARLKDEKLEKCIAEQDAYNKKIERQLNANS